MSVLVRVVQWFADPAHWTGPDGIPTRLVQHIQLSAESVLIGAAIALPVGIALGHYGRFGNLAINISNVGRAVPSFALLVLAFQIFGLGDAPIIISLTALAIPPMVTNSYVAMQEVDPDVKDAARGMGYRELAQVLWVELPLAVPLLMAGIRTSAVQVVATATLAALIASHPGRPSCPGDRAWARRRRAPFGAEGHPAAEGAVDPARHLQGGLGGRMRNRSGFEYLSRPYKERIS